MNDDQQDLDSAIHHARVLTWVCVALFVVLDVVGLTASSQSDPRFVLADVKLATLESLTLSDLLG